MGAGRHDRQGRRGEQPCRGGGETATRSGSPGEGVLHDGLRALPLQADLGVGRVDGRLQQRPEDRATHDKFSRRAAYLMMIRSLELLLTMGPMLTGVDHVPAVPPRVAIHRSNPPTPPLRADVKIISRPSRRIVVRVSR